MVRCWFQSLAAFGAIPETETVICHSLVATTRGYARRRCLLMLAWPPKPGYTEVSSLEARSSWVQPSALCGLRTPIGLSGPRATLRSVWTKVRVTSSVVGPVPSLTRTSGSSECWSKNFKSWYPQFFVTERMQPRCWEKPKLCRTSRYASRREAKLPKIPILLTCSFHEFLEEAFDISEGHF